MALLMDTLLPGASCASLRPLSCTREPRPIINVPRPGQPPPAMHHRSTPHLFHTYRLQPQGDLAGHTTCALSAVPQLLPVRLGCRAVGQRSATAANVVVQHDDQTTDMARRDLTGLDGT